MPVLNIVWLLRLYAVTSTTDGTIDLHIFGKSKIIFDVVVVDCKELFEVLISLLFIVDCCWLLEGISCVYPTTDYQYY